MTTRRTTRNMSCHIRDDIFLRGLRTVCLENEHLEICVLVDRGADIYSFRCKHKNENVLLNLPDRLRNPARDISQMRNTTNQFEDYYYGGWQEILPNSAPLTYRGASLGQHGEVSLIPWDYAIEDRGPDIVSLRLSVQPLRFPLRLEKTISLRKADHFIEIKERLTNLSSTSIDLMWGHHIAFGRSFLSEGATITTNAKTIISEPEMPAARRFKPGVETHWPSALDLEDRKINADEIPVYGRHGQSDLSYLSGYPSEANYQITSRALDLSFRLSWQGDLFSHLWYWQEYHGVRDFPWWGDCYTVALEPWTSSYSSEPLEEIAKGKWLKLAPHEIVKTQLKAEIISHDEGKVE